MSTQEALATWVGFLETQPPNTPIEISELVHAATNHYAQKTFYIPAPPIDIHCEREGGTRKFNAKHRINLVESPDYSFITYRCRNCLATEKTFAVMIEWADDGGAEVMKLGEYPPFSAPISPRIQKLFSAADLELYRKGNRATAQGLGIGAASYFRRVVEDQWSRLVMELRQAADRLGVENLDVYDAALRETQFSRAVEMLKDALPAKLLILDGQNPLTLLYQPLSQQLHGLTDEQCLQQAADIRTVLTSLLENIAVVLKDQDELREAARRLTQS